VFSLLAEQTQLAGFLGTTDDVSWLSGGRTVQSLLAFAVSKLVRRSHMRAVLKFMVLLAGILFPAALRAQGPTPVRGADERFKVDILVVVAHPDDEGAVTPYLARAIYDLRKRVAVVYGTHGGSGGNNYGRSWG
jgi:hypothetical protein